MKKKNYQKKKKNFKRENKYFFLLFKSKKNLEQIKFKYKVRKKLIYIWKILKNIMNINSLSNMINTNFSLSNSRKKKEWGLDYGWGLT